LYSRDRIGCFDNSNENGYHLRVKFESQKNSSSNQKPEATAAASGERVMSQQLFGERRELIIEHNGRDYRLRLTQNGKLILTA
jgi:hemin uptake protein HemP